MQRAKFWIVSNFPESAESAANLRQQIYDANWANFLSFSNSGFSIRLLLLRFVNPTSADDLIIRLNCLEFAQIQNIQFSYDQLTAAETAHYDQEQKNVYVCRLPPILRNSVQLANFVSQISPKIKILDSSEYYTIRCELAKTASFIATFLRALPCFQQRIIAVLSVKLLPIALIFKLPNDVNIVTTYDGKDMEKNKEEKTIYDLKLFRSLKQQFNGLEIAPSHVKSNSMKIVAVTADNMNDIDYIIDAANDEGYDAKRFLSVPEQEEIEKYEIILENIPEENLIDLRNRIKRDFTASIYEARIIKKENGNRDALIIFYDPEDANKVVQSLSKQGASYYRTIVLLHNLPPDVTKQELFEFLREGNFFKEPQQIEQNIQIHNILDQNNMSFSFAEVKLPEINMVARLIEYCACSGKTIRNVYIPFAFETRRIRYKREVTYDKFINSIVRENSILVKISPDSKSSRDLLMLIEKLKFPIQFFGNFESYPQLNHNNEEKDDFIDYSKSIIITYQSLEESRKALSELSEKDFDVCIFDSSVLLVDPSSGGCKLFNPFRAGKNEVMYFCDEPTPATQKTPRGNPHFKNYNNTNPHPKNFNNGFSHSKSFNKSNNPMIRSNLTQRPSHV